MEQKTGFTAKRRFLSAEQHLNFTPGKIFPQLCPTREYDWIETWKCDLLYSKSGFAELDCIFTTHFPGSEKETWVVDRFEPNELIEFVRTAESRVIRHSIRLSNNNDGSTTLFWLHIITALNGKGNQYVENCSDEEFRQQIQALEKMLGHFLETGKMLKTGK
jgi:hypothetical protein